MGLSTDAFLKLRPPCVELSNVGLKFRGHQNTPNDVLKALEAVYEVLNELGKQDALDEKLAEYAFFPLSHVFNETQRLTLRCLEVAVNCLRILIEKGWKQYLSPQMGKQLIILLTILVGGNPTQSKEPGGLAKPQSEELAVAGIKCLSAIFKALEGPVAEQEIYNEVGTATIIDQTVYILLEGVTDGCSDDVQKASVAALQALYTRITDRVVLASIMPRTVSALTKTLKPTTQMRRSFRVLQMCLKLLTETLRTVLNDRAVKSGQGKAAGRSTSDDRIVLDDSWLKATASQIKIALANVIQIRRHERPEVQNALLDLCLMVIEQCPKSLKDSLPMMVETVVVLSELDSNQTPNDAYSALKHLATTYPDVVDILKDSLHTWITSFPRTMQSNDETAKQRAIKQISTTFQILSQIQSGSDIHNSNMASGLCDSVAAVINSATSVPQPLSSTGDASANLSILCQETNSHSFPPVLLDRRSQQQTLVDLQSMITRLNHTNSADAITHSIMSRLRYSSDDSIIAPFWLALNFLKSTPRPASRFEDFISLDQTESSSLSPSRSSVIEELYYIALPILNEHPTSTPRDWRASALALEAVALQAQQLGEAFRPELMDALYPVLQFLASSNRNLQIHSMTCLNILTAACNYPDTSTMIIENVDYLVNSVSLKLNTFDVSPYPPQVLLMMVKLCGARLIPYLDDLVDTIFGILDMYHGYPKLVELLFSTLAAIVEEGVKRPSLLAITSGGESDVVNHRKNQYKHLLISQLAEDFATRRAKRVRDEELEMADGERVSHPKRPWTMELDGPEQPKDETDSLPDALEAGESDEPLPPPREPEDAEKPLSKPHTILLHIVKSIPSHLSSPSPFLRRSLLSILAQALPILAPNENSFLPLINDLWPSVSSRITFPPSFTSDSSTTALVTTTLSAVNRQSKQTMDEADIKEETFVIVAACSAITTMCEGAGDFMASRIEAEFPRWARLYRRAWEKVSADADKVIERRAQHRQRMAYSNQKDQQGAVVKREAPRGLDQALGLSLSTSSSTAAGARTFTPHHSLWRALTSLFITLLTHVRLPLHMGDEICEFLGAWIAKFAGPDYYFATRIRRSTTEDSNGPSQRDPEVEAVNNAIQAMESWNIDLTWFIFRQERTRISALTKQTGVDGVRNHQPVPGVGVFDKNPESSSRKWRFAEVVF